MTIRISILVIATLTTGSALAQELANCCRSIPRIFRRRVRKAVHYANQECTRQGGGAARFAPDTVRKVDLTGDGRNDYIVD